MSNYSLRNGADSPLPIGDIPVTPEGDYKTPHETPRAFFANGGEFRRAPRLRLQGRSLSARDPSYDFDSSPPPLRQHSPFRSKGRLLPNTPPEEAAMYEKNGRQQQTHGFWQLSPSEERIRRTRRQLSVNEDYEYGSHSLSPSPRLSPRHSPRASSNCSPSSPTPPTSTHASAQYLSVNPEDHLPRPPQEFRPSRDAATYRRMNFSRSAQVGALLRI
ncbi:hypothetical protein QR680_014128 [Steinernema hermaphroditum]|uniref:Uncharacterized protein n=1 Tax=Steinernema hermaphroditum TaxID=289476 RepID=A0AA39I7T0_9BILA|nr:hypothetical protein QR680_014128 [Steinernema hermaphroditum]